MNLFDEDGVLQKARLEIEEKIRKLHDVSLIDTSTEEGEAELKSLMDKVLTINSNNAIVGFNGINIYTVTINGIFKLTNKHPKHKEMMKMIKRSSMLSRDLYSSGIIHLTDISSSVSFAVKCGNGGDVLRKFRPA